MNDPITCIRSSGSQSNSQSNFKSRPQHSQGDFQSNYSSRINHPQGQSSQRRYSNAVASTPNFGQQPVACFYCNQAHLMTNCKGFLSLSMNDRRQFCYSQRLCFGCLRHGHSNRDCLKRMQCSTCSGQHPTVLLDDNRQQSNYVS